MLRQGPMNIENLDRPPCDVAGVATLRNREALYPVTVTPEIFSDNEALRSRWGSKFDTIRSNTPDFSEYFLKHWGGY